jgi:5-methylcytosine-specific restriction endonuclease McrA
MPFKKERYPVDWPEIRVRIIQRDGNRCKFCRAPNGAWISRDKNFQWGIEKGAYMLADGGEVFGYDGTPFGTWRGSEWEGDKAVKVVLTVAHLDHDETRNSDDNLASLCQRCHLAHDRVDNLKRAKKTRHARKADRELF